MARIPVTPLESKTNVAALPFAQLDRTWGWRNKVPFALGTPRTPHLVGGSPTTRKRPLRYVMSCDGVFHAPGSHRSRFATLLLSIASPSGGRAKEGQINIGQVVYVTEDGVSIRDTPSTGGIVIDTLTREIRAPCVDARPVEADGIEWWNVSDDHVGIEGWIAGDWISADLFAIATNTPMPASWMLTQPFGSANVRFDGDTTGGPRPDFRTSRALPRRKRQTNRHPFHQQGCAYPPLPYRRAGNRSRSAARRNGRYEIQGGAPAGIYTFYCSVPGHKEAACSARSSSTQAMRHHHNGPRCRRSIRLRRILGIYRSIRCRDCEHYRGESKRILFRWLAGYRPHPIAIRLDT